MRRTRSPVAPGRTIDEGDRRDPVRVFPRLIATRLIAIGLIAMALTVPFVAAARLLARTSGTAWSRRMPILCGRNLGAV